MYRDKENGGKGSGVAFPVLCLPQKPVDLDVEGYFVKNNRCDNISKQDASGRAEKPCDQNTGPTEANISLTLDVLCSKKAKPTAVTCQVHNQGENTLPKGKVLRKQATICKTGKQPIFLKAN